MPADVLLVASTAGALGSLLAWQATEPGPEAARLPMLEQARREALRKESKAYRTCEHGIIALAKLFARMPGGSLESVRRSLAVLGKTNWMAPEAIAVRVLPCWAIAAIAGLALLQMYSLPAGLGIGLLFALLAPFYVVRDLRKDAAKRMKQIRNRLPDTLDLMALVLEAGAGTLPDCLRYAMEENAGHPIGDEMRKLHFGIETGGRAVDQFRSLAERLHDPDIGELAAALVTSEERGLPLKETFRGLSERLRARQTQWLETEAEEAKVKIVGPTSLIMVACLLIITATFIVQLIK
jgi:Flp pilus assembly protein TadB